MKRVAILAIGALVALGLMPATAGAGGTSEGTGMVTIVHDATYDFPSEPFPVYICVDNGDTFETAAEVGDVFGPLELPAGTYDVAIYPGADSCDSKTSLADEITVDPGADVTVAAIWGTDGPSLVVWSNDSSCYEQDTSSRLTVRHGATTGGPVDIVGLIDGVETTVISGLAEGAQETLDLPGGLTVTDAAVVLAGTDTVVIELGDQTFDAGSHYVIYAAGGNDGGAGVFPDVIELVPCEVPVEPTTTAPAPAAAAVAARPAFTG